MNSRVEIQELSHTRLKEARTLFEKGFYNGACYMAGYSVELALKAALCKTLDIDKLFCDSFKAQTKVFRTHNLADLLVFSGLWTKFEIARDEDREFDKQWSYLQGIWSEQLRYEPVEKMNLSETQKLLDAIDNPTQGILQWIRKHW